MQIISSKGFSYEMVWGGSVAVLCQRRTFNEILTPMREIRPVYVDFVRETALSFWASTKIDWYFKFDVHDRIDYTYTPIFKNIAI